MVGRQVIEVTRPFTLQELNDFMEANWNKEEFNAFNIGKPTGMSVGEYILLPATHRFQVIVYPKAAGGLFNKENKVVLTTCDTPAGAQEASFEYMPTGNALTKLWQTSKVLDAEKERKGPAEEVLQIYTAHMKDILARNGLIK